MPDFNLIAKQINELIFNISKVVKGKDEIIKLILMGLISDGSVLLRDVPGVGKTMLAKCLAKSIHGDFKRIQFTPDLMPSDITGLNIFNQKEREFEFRPGPVFTNILLADEINRATPKTQAALLEAMEEKQVTIDGVLYKLPKPFFVIATQNPLDYESTYALPAAQMDRFSITTEIGFPTREIEIEILKDQVSNYDPTQDLQAVCTTADIITWQEALKHITVNPKIYELLAEIALQSRIINSDSGGFSTRAMIRLCRVALASALMDGRDYVAIEDIKRVIYTVLEHRISYFESNSTAKINEILQKVNITL
jgi:MoxR-like ATPase